MQCSKPSITKAEIGSLCVCVSRMFSMCCVCVCSVCFRCVRQAHHCALHLIVQKCTFTQNVYSPDCNELASDVLCRVCHPRCQADQEVAQQAQHQAGAKSVVRLVSRLCVFIVCVGCECYLGRPGDFQKQAPGKSKSRSMRVDKPDTHSPRINRLNLCNALHRTFLVASSSVYADLLSKEPPASSSPTISAAPAKFPNHETTQSL